MMVITKSGVGMGLKLGQLDGREGPDSGGLLLFLTPAEQERKPETPAADQAPVAMLRLWLAVPRGGDDVGPPGHR